jgi:hypothetical protein
MVSQSLIVLSSYDLLTERGVVLDSLGDSSRTLARGERNITDFVQMRLLAELAEYWEGTCAGTGTAS